MVLGLSLIFFSADTGGDWGLDRGQANGWNPGGGVGSWSPANNSIAEWPLA